MQRNNTFNNPSTDLEAESFIKGTPRPSYVGVKNTKSRKYAMIGAAFVILFFFILVSQTPTVALPIEINRSSKFRFAIVSDLDRMSADKLSSKPRWRSVLKFGTLHHDGNGWDIDFESHAEKELSSFLGEAGRGMELSELIYHNDQLLAFDDRSGIVFQIVSKSNPTAAFKSASMNLNDQFIVMPKYILTEGNGISSPKGQKTEWATVKDSKLYVGSFGKEFTTGDTIVHTNNMWISIIDEKNEITHTNWKSKYDLLRMATNTLYPGYMIHEAIHFNDYSREWFILPRRVSSEKYDEKLDEMMGSNLMIVVDEAFENVKRVVVVGEKVPERGFSSFKFVPGTNGGTILALKTVEKEDKITGDSEQTSFLSLFDIDGNVLMNDVEVPGGYKFEGLEFI